MGTGAGPGRSKRVLVIPRLGLAGALAAAAAAATVLVPWAATAGPGAPAAPATSAAAQVRTAAGSEGTQSPAGPSVDPAPPQSYSQDLPVAPDRAGAPARFGPRYGTDISWPQCGQSLPDLGVDFTVIGVTAGQAGTVNPCLAEQVRWAREQRSTVAVYVVPATPGATARQVADRAGDCGGVPACVADHAGRAQARHALAAAKAAGLEAPGWFLDVEESVQGTLWGADTAENVAVLRGWERQLRAAGRTVGVYSTAGYWQEITGGWSTTLPQWVAVGEDGVEAAKAACDRPFSAGPVVLTQWLTGPLDANLLCPGQDAPARALFGSFARPRSAGIPPLLLIPVPHGPPLIDPDAKAPTAEEVARAKAKKAAAEKAAAKKRAAQKAGAAKKAAAQKTAREAAKRRPPARRPGGSSSPRRTPAPTTTTRAAPAAGAPTGATTSPGGAETRSGAPSQAPLPLAPTQPSADASPPPPVP